MHVLHPWESSFFAYIPPLKWNVDDIQGLLQICVPPYKPLRSTYVHFSHTHDQEGNLDRPMFKGIFVKWARYMHDELVRTGKTNEPGVSNFIVVVSQWRKL